MNSKTFFSKVAQKTLVDKILRYIFMTIAIICSMAIAIIAIFIIYRGSLPFIKKYSINGQLYHVNLWHFLTGNTWFKSPNIYGVGFIIINTFYVTILALILAIPLSILTALFIVRIAPKMIGTFLNSIIELLASVPSVIYGLFGVGVINSLVKNMANAVGYQSAGGLSTLSTVLVLAMMITPTVTLVSITAIKAVKVELINGSVALGASFAQTNYKVVLTAAKSGIFSGIILGVGRALGEATAVSMVCGNSTTGSTFNLFQTTRTLTSTMMLGLHETTGMDYDIRFSVGILLILIIIVSNLGLNIIKNRIGKVHGR